MKISSLFRGRAYVVGAQDRLAENARFVAELFKKMDRNVGANDVKLIISNDDYDDYELTDDNGRPLRIKISFDKGNYVLKQESKNLKAAQSPVCGYWMGSGDIKLGDEFSYLLYAFPTSESISEIGRSLLVSESHEIFRSYAKFQQTKPLKKHYKTILKGDIANYNLKKVLSTEEKQRVKNHTDYEALESLSLAFMREALDLFPDPQRSQWRKCHGNLSLYSIFFNGSNFYFDNLYNNSMGHPYVDFIELVLNSGLDRAHEKDLLPLFCEYAGLQLDKRLYHALYESLLRKKVAELISTYIYEVYVYNSYRIQKILNIADTFSQCYDRFRVIPIFEENRKFILKTLTEPILGVKA